MADDPNPELELKLAVDVNIKDPAWTEALPQVEALAAEVVCKVLARPASWRHFEAGIPVRPVEVSVCFAGNLFVQGLNAKYREKNTPTNVLSFSAADGGRAAGEQEVLLGDIVLAFGVVAEEAKTQGKSLHEHTVHLLVHGVLHLAGYSHQDEPGTREMEKLEIETLSGFGITNPYAAPEARRL